MWLNRCLPLLAALLALGVSPLAIPAVSVSATPVGGFTITPGIAVVNQSVATITINSDADYEVTLKDDNNGQLLNGASSIAYTVKYDNGPEISLSTTTTSVETGASVTNGSRSLTVFIAAGASVGIPAGNYTATVTIEILAI